MTSDTYTDIDTLWDDLDTSEGEVSNSGSTDGAYSIDSLWDDLDSKESVEEDKPYEYRFWDRVKESTYSMVSDTFGFAGLAVEAAGDKWFEDIDKDEKVRDYFIKKWDEWGQKATDLELTHTDLKDVLENKSAVDFLKFAGEGAASFVPDAVGVIAGTALSGGAGGSLALGRTVGRKAVKGMLNDRFRKYLKEEVAENGLEKVALENAYKRVGSEVGRTAGMMGYMFARGGGGAASTELEKMGVEDASFANANLVGLAYAGLSLASPVELALSGKLGTEAGKAVIAKTFLKEAFQETTEDTVDVLHESGIDPNVTFLEAIQDPDTLWRLANSFAMGGILGAPVGAYQSVVNRVPTDEEAEDIVDNVEKEVGKEDTKDTIKFDRERGIDSLVDKALGPLMDEGIKAKEEMFKGTAAESATIFRNEGELELPLGAKITEEANIAFNKSPEEGYSRVGVEPAEKTTALTEGLTPFEQEKAYEEQVSTPPPSKLDPIALTHEVLVNSGIEPGTPDYNAQIDRLSKVATDYAARIKADPTSVSVVDLITRAVQTYAKNKQDAAETAKRLKERGIKTPEALEAVTHILQTSSDPKVNLVKKRAEITKRLAELDAEIEPTKAVGYVGQETGATTAVPTIDTKLTKSEIEAAKKEKEAILESIPDTKVAEVMSVAKTPLEKALLSGNMEAVLAALSSGYKKDSYMAAVKKAAENIVPHVTPKSEAEGVLKNSVLESFKMIKDISIKSELEGKATDPLRFTKTENNTETASHKELGKVDIKISQATTNGKKTYSIQVNGKTMIEGIKGIAKAREAANEYATPLTENFIKTQRKHKGKESVKDAEVEAIKKQTSESRAEAKEKKDEMAPSEVVKPTLSEEEKRAIIERANAARAKAKIQKDIEITAEPEGKTEVEKTDIVSTMQDTGREVESEFLEEFDMAPPANQEEKAAYSDVVTKRAEYEEAENWLTSNKKAFNTGKITYKDWHKREAIRDEKKRQFTKALEKAKYGGDLTLTPVSKSDKNVTQSQIDAFNKQGKTAYELLQEVVNNPKVSNKFGKVVARLLLAHVDPKKLKNLRAQATSAKTTSMYHGGIIWIHSSHLNDPTVYLHEVVHSITVEEMLGNPAGLTTEVKNLLNLVKKHVADNNLLSQEELDTLDTFRGKAKSMHDSNYDFGEKTGLAYGLLNEKEFLSQALSSVEFQEILKNIKLEKPVSGIKTAYQRMIKIIRETFGIAGVHQTALERAMELTVDLATFDPWKAKKESEPAPIFAGKIGDLKGTWTTAEQMEKEGKGTKEIWKETGWIKSPLDNKWRYEIDDSKMTLSEAFITAVQSGNEYSGKLDKTIDHPELFKTYPVLGKYTVEGVYEPTEPWSGQFDEETRTITLNFADPVSPAKDIILHELQHAIQKIEGFDLGASPKRLSMDQIVRSVKENIDNIKTLFSDETLAMYEDIATMEDIDLAEVIVNEVESILLDTSLEEDSELRSIANDISYMVYRSKQGETEALETEQRRKMGAEKRQENLPKFPYETVDPELQGMKPWAATASERMYDDDLTSLSVNKVLDFEEALEEKENRSIQLELSRNNLQRNVKKINEKIASILPFLDQLTRVDKLALLIGGKTDFSRLDKLIRQPLQNLHALSQETLTQEVISNSVIQSENVLYYLDDYIREASNFKSEIEDFLKNHNRRRQSERYIATSIREAMSDNKIKNISYAQPKSKKVELTSEQKRAEDIANIKAMLNEKSSLTAVAKKVGDPIRRGLRKNLRGITDLLNEKHPNLAFKIREMEKRIRTRIGKRHDDIAPFSKKMKELNRKNVVDYARLALHLSNDTEWDIQERDALLRKHGLTEDFKKVQKVLDHIAEGMKEVGLDSNEYLKDYYPRVVQDPKGLMRALKKNEDYGHLDAILDEYMKKNGIKESTPADRAQAISEFLKTGRFPMALRIPRSAKQRIIKRLSSKYLKYYADPIDALVSHIHETAEAIEGRKFIGVSKRPSYMKEHDRLMKELTKKDLTPEDREAKSARLVELKTLLTSTEADLMDGINSFIAEMVIDKKIKHDDQYEVAEAIRARLNQKGMHGPLAHVRDIGLISALGNIVSTATQLTDIAHPIFEYGIVPTLQATFGKRTYKYEDLDLGRAMTELSSNPLSRYVDGILKYTGFKALDGFMKAVSMEASIKAAKGLSRSQFYKKYSAEFGKDIDNIYEAIRSGKKDNPYLSLFAFTQLSKIQPVSLSEMPMGYNTGGNNRIFYTLKSYNLKVANRLYNEMIQGFDPKKKPAERAKALKNFAMYAGLLVLAGATIDELKDWMLGRDTEFSDNVTNNILKMFFLSRYTLDKGFREGFVSTILFDVLAPPLDWIDSPIKDMVGWYKGKPTYKSLALVPLGGKVVYARTVEGKSNLLERKKEDINRKILEMYRDKSYTWKDIRADVKEYNDDVRKVNNAIKEGKGSKEDRLSYIDSTYLTNSRRRARKKLREEKDKDRKSSFFSSDKKRREVGVTVPKTYDNSQEVVKEVYSELYGKEGVGDATGAAITGAMGVTNEARSSVPNSENMNDAEVSLAYLTQINEELKNTMTGYAEAPMEFQKAVLDHAYNDGVKDLLSYSGFNKKLKEKDYLGALKELLDTANISGASSKGLAKRRAQSYNMLADNKIEVIIQRSDGTVIYKDEQGQVVLSYKPQNGKHNSSKPGMLRV